MTSPYTNRFPKGARVRVRALADLLNFQKTWLHHHPVTDEMLHFSERETIVDAVSFYHGGDVLYGLAGVPGVWHQACLEDPGPLATRLKVVVYVALVNESVDVWRPVEATQLGADSFLIDEKSVPENEEWQFQPGERVRCFEKQFEDGSFGRVAIARM